MFGSLALGRLVTIIKGSQFAKNIVKVVFGTVLAQLISLCAIPILTRVYSVESFGVLGVCVALSNVFKVIFSCRYDFAIPTAKEDLEAGSLLWLTFFLSSFFCALTYGVILLIPISYIEKFGEAKYLLPLIFFISSVDNVLSLWVNRIKRFGVFSGSRIVRAFSVAIFQFLIGVYLSVDVGLIVGLFAGEIVTVSFVLICLYLSSAQKIGKISVKSIVSVAKKYCHNPIYLLPGHAMNMGVSQLPIIIIEAIYGSSAAGLLYMGQKVVSLPGQLISAAAFKVYFPEAARRYNKTGSCYDLARKTVFGTFLLCVILFIVVDVVSYNFIGHLLGTDWNGAKLTILIYSAIELLPAVFHPISGTWFITNNQRANLKYQFLRSAIVAVGLIVGVSIGGYYITLISYGVFRSVAFSLFLMKCISLSKGNDARKLQVV